MGANIQTNSSKKKHNYLLQYKVQCIFIGCTSDWPDWTKSAHKSSSTAVGLAAAAI